MTTFLLSNNRSNDLLRHKRETHCTEKKFVCQHDDCDSRFFRKDDLRHHIKRKHETPQDTLIQTIIDTPIQTTNATPVQTTNKRRRRDHVASSGGTRSGSANSRNNRRKPVAKPRKPAGRPRKTLIVKNDIQDKDENEVNPHENAEDDVEDQVDNDVDDDQLNQELDEELHEQENENETEIRTEESVATNLRSKRNR